MKGPRLTREERRWLASYRGAVNAEHPGDIEQMLLYGSKARGEAGPDSDLDVLLIVRNAAAARKRKLRRIGYLLAAGSEVVPSIIAYTSAEWEQLRRSGSPFRRAVERDEVAIL